MPADPAPLRMHRISLRFADRDCEAAFAREQAAKAVQPARIAIAAVALLVIAFTVILHLPGVFVGIPRSDVLRYFAGGLATCAVSYAATATPFFLRRQQLAMAAFACVMWLGVIESATLSPRAVIEARGYTLPLIFTFTFYGLFRLRMSAATTVGLFGMALYLALHVRLDLLGPAALNRAIVVLGIANLCGLVICRQIELSARREFVAMRSLDAERRRSEDLLLNVLPGAIAQRLKASPGTIADHSDGVTVLFADIVGFTPLSAGKSPHELVALLNRVFSAFDTLADRHGLEKIKTVGDAYMAVAGLPKQVPDHAACGARMAAAMHRAIAEISAQTGEPLMLRIGLHSGPVVAGVIGLRKFSYDLWGDTVNTASRMESHGLPSTTHCTEATAALLEGVFKLKPRGVVDVKGKGPMRTFLVEELESSAA